jgi:hypothetical protein
MPKRLLSNLTWKAGVAAAAVALAAGTGATTIAFVNASDAKPAVTTPNEHASDTAGAHAGDKADDGTDTDKADDDTKAGDATTTAEDDATTAGNDAAEHPDNFGATVSEDAKDGGVDGREIRDLAPGAAHRNSAATDAHEANADATGGDQAKDEHAVDGQDKADDANGDHGKPATGTDTSDD